jgi:hypothetical protein
VNKVCLSPFHSAGQLGDGCRTRSCGRSLGSGLIRGRTGCSRSRLRSCCRAALFLRHQPRKYLIKPADKRMSESCACANGTDLPFLSTFQCIPLSTHHFDHDGPWHRSVWRIFDGRFRSLADVGDCALQHVFLFRRPKPCIGRKILARSPPKAQDVD